jgi:hypothetical protein
MTATEIKASQDLAVKRAYDTMRKFGNVSLIYGQGKKMICKPQLEGYEVEIINVTSVQKKRIKNEKGFEVILKAEMKNVITFC